ncbi:MAG: hypothetical protein H6715_01365 [Myxococcales bacterium]|nr:hypothetical protein [Myxococcales bacterium]MCB9708943.1 hypothetical protein [Myxococcales bacterium]
MKQLAYGCVLRVMLGVLTGCAAESAQNPIDQDKGAVSQELLDRACDALDVVYPHGIDKRFAGDVLHPAFFIGANAGVSGSLGYYHQTGFAGMDVVFDLSRQEMMVADYAGSGSGTGDLLGFGVSASAYAGMGFGLDHGVQDWLGWFVGRSTSFNPIPVLSQFVDFEYGSFGYAADLNDDGIIARSGSAEEVIEPPSGVYGRSIGAKIGIDILSLLSGAVNTVLTAGLASPPVQVTNTSAYWRSFNFGTAILYATLLRAGFEVSFVDEDGSACDCFVANRSFPERFFDGPCARLPWLGRDETEEERVCRVRFDNDRDGKAMSSAMSCIGEDALLSGGCIMQSDRSALYNAMARMRLVNRGIGGAAAAGMIDLGSILSQVTADLRNSGFSSALEACPDLFVEKEACEDGIDNDGNNLVDCADPACASDGFCSCTVDPAQPYLRLNRDYCARDCEKWDSTQAGIAACPDNYACQDEGWCRSAQSCTANSDCPTVSVDAELYPVVCVEGQCVSGIIHQPYNAVH